MRRPVPDEASGDGTGRCVSGALGHELSRMGMRWSSFVPGRAARQMLQLTHATRGGSEGPRPTQTAAGGKEGDEASDAV